MVKDVLGALVDTEIWNVINQDVRTRERINKSKIIEIDVELRLLTDSHNKLLESFNTSFSRQQIIEAELEVTKNKLLNTHSLTNGTSLNSSNQVISVDEMNMEINNLTKTNKAMTLTIEPLRKEIIDFLKTRKTLTSTIDQTLQQKRENNAQLKASLTILSTNSKQLQLKIKSLESQIQNTHIMKKQLTLALEDGSSSNLVEYQKDKDNVKIQNTKDYQLQLEESLAILSSLNIQLSTINKSLERLVDLKTSTSINTSKLIAMYKYTSILYYTYTFNRRHFMSS